MGQIFLILGGANSGKSRHAEDLAKRTHMPFTFLATGEAFDDETSTRIANCRARRPKAWTTVESPELEKATLKAVPEHTGLLVDSLSSHIAHLVRSHADDIVGTYLRSGVVGLDRWLGPTRRLLEFARLGPQLTLIVSDEAGMSVVPTTQMARAYRELLGLANQAVGQIADQSMLIVASRVLNLE